MIAWTSLPKASSASDVIAIGLMADISLGPLSAVATGLNPARCSACRNHRLKAQLKTVYNGAAGRPRRLHVQGAVRPRRGFVCSRG